MQGEGKRKGMSCLESYRCFEMRGSWLGSNMVRSRFDMKFEFKILVEI